jgi:hypothetical protein
MALDPREFIRLHAGMPEHPKVDPLSDAAFRCLIEAWCLCRRTRNDGRIPVGTWQKKWKAKARKELIDAGLVVLDKDAAVMRDWLEHQPSVEDLDLKRQARIEAGRKGGVKSGESRRGGSKPATKPEANASALASPELEQQLKQNPNQIEPELEIEKESSYVGGVSYVGNAREIEPPPPSCPRHSEFTNDCADCVGSSVGREQWLRDRIAATEPPRYCPRHPTGTDIPCRDCQALRLLHEQWRQDREGALAERRRADAAAQSAAARSTAEDRARAIENCTMCDAEGRIDGWVCGHDPARMPKPGRGAAAVRLARCRMCDADGLQPDGARCDHSSPSPDPPPSASVPTGRSEQASQDQPTTQENAHA